MTKEQIDLLLNRGHITPQTHERMVQYYNGGGFVGASPLRSDQEVQAEIAAQAAAEQAKARFTPGSYPSAQAAAMAQPAPTPERVPMTTETLYAAPSPTPVPQPERVPGSEPQAAQQPGAQPGAQPQVPVGPGMPFPLVMPGAKQQMEAIQQKYLSETMVGKEAAKQYADAAKALEDRERLEAANRQKIQQNLDSLRSEIQVGKIDPNRVWENAGTGSKIGAIVGMLVSGIGAGVTGKENLAIANINRVIDRDIDAQKASFNNKSTLYGMYLKDFQNSRDAETAARLHLLTVADTKIKEAMAKAATPQALANLKMGEAEVLNRITNYQFELAKNMSQAQSMGLMGQQPGFPIGKVPASLALDKDYQAKRVPMLDRGVEMQAGTPKEGEEMRRIEATYSEVNNMLDELKSLASLGNQLTPTGRARAKQIETELPALLNSLKGYTQFTEAHEDYLKKTFTPSGIARSVFAPNAETDQLKHNIAQSMERKRATTIPGYKPVTTFQPRGK